ncbi:MAG TPA: RNase adapter RapZ [Alphaproteobacteria bacterium]|nr:RNase adapter RapZ [Alphaproteobacteria bacterium]HNS43792.1 RNase adapter RapZ [Alphaproteobacteria bacterium]
MTNPDPPYLPSFIFVTGLSGAGISSAMNILEDIGFLGFDNFPLSLLPALLQQEDVEGRSVAVAIDTRAAQFDPVKLMDAIKNLKARNQFHVKILFLTADDTVLLKRFTETRRVHPMARDRAVADGITAEKSLLFPFKHEAGYIVDTSEYSIHDLRRVIEGFAGGLLHDRMNITLMSFSYRHGLPREADLVFDVRFLRNPNWVTALKEKTGLEQEVQDYVRGDAAHDPFLSGVKGMMDILLPRYQSEGKSYLTVAFGCTGGRHRSVTLVEEIGEYLHHKNLPVQIHHRETKGS